MMCIKTILPLCILFSTLIGDNFVKSSQCEILEISQCAFLKNIDASNDQDESRQWETELFHYVPLMQTHCAPTLSHYLCAYYYYYLCKNEYFLCRNWCLDVVSLCDQNLNHFNMKDDKVFSCAQFPLSSEANCILTFSVGNKSLQFSQPPGGSAEVTMKLKQETYECPARLATNLHSQYRLVAGWNNHIDNCAQPSSPAFPFIDPLRESSINLILLCQSAVTCLSLLFSIVSGSLGQCHSPAGRFSIPEWHALLCVGSCLPIACALFIANLLQWVHPITFHHLQTTLLQQFTFTATFSENLLCSVLFWLFYFGLQSVSIWWSLLNAIWYVTVSHHWAPEIFLSPRRFSHWLFVAAITIPALMCLVASRFSTSLQIDSISHLCLPRQPQEMLLLLVLPQTAFLLVGCGFFTANVRHTLRLSRHMPESDPIVRQRIALHLRRMLGFGLLHILHTAVLVGIWLRELIQFDHLFSHWFHALCQDVLYQDVACDQSATSSGDARLEFILQIVKYWCLLAGGLLGASFWLWNRKTFQLYANQCSGGGCLTQQKKKKKSQHELVVIVLPDSTTSSSTT